MYIDVAGRNDRAIMDDLEALSNAMAQVNQNQNGGAAEFCGVGKFQRNNHLPSRENMIHKVIRHGSERL